MLLVSRVCTPQAASYRGSRLGTGGTALAGTQDCHFLCSRRPTHPRRGWFFYVTSHMLFLHVAKRRHWLSASRILLEAYSYILFSTTHCAHIHCKVQSSQRTLTSCRVTGLMFQPHPTIASTVDISDSTQPGSQRAATESPNPAPAPVSTLGHNRSLPHLARLHSDCSTIYPAKVRISRHVLSCGSCHVG